MYKIFLLSILFTTTILNAQEYQSRWQQSPIEIDGHIEDWDERPGLFDSKSQFLYAMRNDSSNIYICFEVSDKMIQQKFIHAGLTLKLTAKTKPKTTATISFEAQADNSMKSLEYNQNPKKKLQNSYKLLNPPIITEGFVHSNGIILAGNSEKNKVAFAVDWDQSDALVVELRIPLNELYSNDIERTEITNSTIILEATLAALDKPGRNSNLQDQMKNLDVGMGGGQSSGRGGGGQGESPSGGGRGMGGHPSGDKPEGGLDKMHTAQKLKNKFTLTFH